MTSPILIYQTEDGRLKIEARLEGETLWLTQSQMAELFQSTPENVLIHLKNIFAEGELEQSATTKEFLVVRTEGTRQVQRTLKHYNLDAVLSVGYRVKSAIADTHESDFDKAIKTLSVFKKPKKD